MKFLQDETVPWQRVVGATGSISERGDDGAGAARQAQRLREGEYSFGSRNTDKPVLYLECAKRKSLERVTELFRVLLSHLIFPLIHSPFVFKEAVEVRETPGGGVFTGKWKVSMNQYGWFPDRVNLDD